MKDKIKTSLRSKSNEVLLGLKLFLEADGEITFEMLQEKFPHIKKGKQIGSLFSAITRTKFNGKSLTFSYPVFGSRRKTWKVSKDLTNEEKSELKVVIEEILEERK